MLFLLMLGQVAYVHVDRQTIFVVNFGFTLDQRSQVMDQFIGNIIAGIVDPF